MKKILLSSFFLAVGVAEARPPEDLIMLPPPKKRGMRIIRNKNITYTNEQPDEKSGPVVVKTRMIVKGRSRPDRSGKVVSQIPAGSSVTPFKWSRDKKWVAIIVKVSGVRAWVPRATLPELDTKLKPIKDGVSEKSSGSSGGAAVDENSEE